MPASANAIAMPLPIVPAPRIATFPIASGLLPGGSAGKLRRFALGEEEMPERFRLLAGDELGEERALALEPIVERKIERSADRFDAGMRRALAARAFREFRGRRLET